MATTTHRVHSRTPPYPPILTSHQQHSLSPHEVTLSHPPRTPTQLAGHAPSQVVYPAPSRKQLLAEDWAHVDMVTTEGKPLSLTHIHIIQGTSYTHTHTHTHTYVLYI